MSEGESTTRPEANTSPGAFRQPRRPSPDAHSHIRITSVNSINTININIGNRPDIQPDTRRLTPSSLRDDDPIGQALTLADLLHRAWIAAKKLIQYFRSRLAVCMVVVGIFLGVLPPTAPPKPSPSRSNPAAKWPADPKPGNAGTIGTPSALPVLPSKAPQPPTLGLPGVRDQAAAPQTHSETNPGSAAPPFSAPSEPQLDRMAQASPVPTVKTPAHHPFHRRQPGHVKKVPATSTSPKARDAPADRAEKAQINKQGIPLIDGFAHILSPFLSPFLRLLPAIS